MSFFEESMIMKARTTMCCCKLPAVNRRAGVSLAIAFVLGLLTQYAMMATCVAQDNTEESVLIAALPEPGSPPSPGTATQTEPSAPATVTESVPTDEPTPLADTVPADAALTDTGATEPSDDHQARNQADEEVDGQADDSARDEAEHEADDEGEHAAEDPAEHAAEDAAGDDEADRATADEKAVPLEDTVPAGVPHVETEVRELSVAPESKPLLPEGRPHWVGSAPDLSNPRRHRLFVGSFPTSSADEADAALDEPLLAAVNGYIDDQVLEGGGAEDLHLTADFIRRNLLDASTEYMAELSTSSGPLYQKWVVLEITPEHREYFVEVNRQNEQKKRMVALGLGLAGLMGVTGLAHLAFNRRRRRYEATAEPALHPAVYTAMHEPEPAKRKRSHPAVILVAGFLVCFFLLALVAISSVTIMHRSTTGHHPMSVITTGDSEHPVIMHPEPAMPPMPPMPPVPPQAPQAQEVYLEHAKAHEMMQRAQTERLRRAQSSWASEQQHEETVIVKGQRDR